MNSQCTVVQAIPRIGRETSWGIAMQKRSAMQSNEMRLDAVKCGIVRRETRQYDVEEMKWRMKFNLIRRDKMKSLLIKRVFLPHHDSRRIIEFIYTGFTLNKRWSVQSRLRRGSSLLRSSMEALEVICASATPHVKRALFLCKTWQFRQY